VAEKLHAMKIGRLTTLFANGWTGTDSRRVSREQIEALYDRLKYVNAGRKFTREEMNER
jgi:hypothetical protein